MKLFFFFGAQGPPFSLGAPSGDIRYLLKALDITLPPNKRGKEGGDDGDDYLCEGETSSSDCVTDEEAPNDI